MDILNDQTVPEESADALIPTELIAPGTPIQFDIVLPATEFLDQHRGGRYKLPTIFLLTRSSIFFLFLLFS